MQTTPVADNHKSIRPYLVVFGALMALTVVTVGASYMHFSIAIAIGVAVFVATIKGTLVASYFMHLASEQKIIYVAMLFTMFFFIAMLVLMLLLAHNQVGRP